MSNFSIGRAGLLALVLVSASCADPKSPTAPNPPPVASLPPVPPAPAPSNSLAAVFGFASSPTRVRAYTEASVYVLNGDGTFVLRYPHVEYRGRYKEADGIITFEWDGWSTAGPWGATGVLTDNSLAVSYNMIMLMSDFEDARYVRMP